MSETSSDTGSSCGWTIISNEGSDIETLASEIVVENEAMPLELATTEEGELASCGTYVEEGTSFDDTLAEQTLNDSLYASRAADVAAEKAPVLSLSDNSDIVTLGDVKDHDHTEGEAAVTEERYLGMSCSSHYAFTAAEPVLPAQQLLRVNTSSSEDEAKQSPNTVVRRRRLRRNTRSLSDMEVEDVMPESDPSEEEKVDKDQTGQEGEALLAPAGVNLQSRCRSILVTCILLTLLVFFCMSFAHLYGKNLVQTHLSLQDRTFVCGEPDIDQSFVFGEAQQRQLSPETESVDQVQRGSKQLLEEDEGRDHVSSDHWRLVTENQRLKDSLHRGEESLATLQEEIRTLRARMKDLEEIGAGVESLLSENHRLKEQITEEKQLFNNIHRQKEDIMGEAQMLRQKLETERKLTGQLRRDLNVLRNQILEEEESGSEVEELQSRLLAMEKRLSYEQQRSDLWERLYVETKEERAKGDTDSKVKKTKLGISGKVKETFDAVKNSTEEFVLHHKEQITKAKEAVKKNLRKFSDSVKSTFRNFKDSASSFIHSARGFYNKKHDEEEASREEWLHRRHKPHQKESFTFHSSHNTRKSADKVHQEEQQSHQNKNFEQCDGMFGCTFQELVSTLNKATDPIQADDIFRLLQSFLQQQDDHFHHGKKLEHFINNLLHNGVFSHDQILFSDFVSIVKDHLASKSHSPDNNMFGDFVEYVDIHLFGKAYGKAYSPRGPSQRDYQDSEKESNAKHQQRKQQTVRSQTDSRRKCSRSGENRERHVADVKIELGPMPFDPKF